MPPRESCPWCKRNKPDASLRRLDEAGLAECSIDSFCWYGIRPGAACIDREGTVRADAGGGLRIVGYIEGGELRLSVANQANEAALIGSVKLDEDRNIARAIMNVVGVLVWAGDREKHRERLARDKDEVQVILRVEDFEGES